MDSNERTWQTTMVIKQAAVLISATSAAQRKRSRRAMVEMALILAVEAGDDVEAWLTEIREQRS